MGQRQRVQIDGGIASLVRLFTGIIVRILSGSPCRVSEREAADLMQTNIIIAGQLIDLSTGHTGASSKSIYNSWRQFDADPE
jgi:hypothetical protein